MPSDRQRVHRSLRPSPPTSPATFGASSGRLSGFLTRCLPVPSMHREMQHQQQHQRRMLPIRPAPPKLSPKMDQAYRFASHRATFAPPDLLHQSEVCKSTPTDRLAHVCGIHAWMSEDAVQLWLICGSRKTHTYTKTSQSLRHTKQITIHGGSRSCYA